MTADESTPAITVRAADLARILDQVHAHQSDDDTLRAIYGVHLDTDGSSLYAVASDRHTMALARTALTAPGTAWAHTITSDAVKTLRAWAPSETRDTPVTITPSTTGGITTVSFGSDTSLVAFQTVDADFPKWRGFFTGILGKEPSGDVVSLDTNYASRWQAAERNLRTWTTSPLGPVVFAGDDFLGLQMPIRPYGETEWDHGKIAFPWLDSLGAADPADPAQLLDGVDTGAHRREFTKRTLWRTVTSSEELMNGVGIDDPRFHDVVNTHVYAWSTYRLMRALAAVSPAFAEKTLADLDDELQGGEFTEWAWEYAQEAGHDPDAWIAEYKAAKGARAAKQAESPSAAPAVE